MHPYLSLLTAVAVSVPVLSYFVCGYVLNWIDAAKTKEARMVRIDIVQFAVSIIVFCVTIIIWCYAGFVLTNQGD